MTEASPLTHSNGSENNNKYHTVGVAIPNTQYKVSKSCMLVIDHCKGMVMLWLHTSAAAAAAVIGLL